MLFLVPLKGEGKSVAELDEECRVALLGLAESQLQTLAGSKSRWLPFLAVIADEASDDARAAQVRVV